MARPFSIPICGFVLAAEGWVWLMRFKVKFALECVDEIVRRYRLVRKPASPTIWNRHETSMNRGWDRFYDEVPPDELRWTAQTLPSERLRCGRHPRQTYE